MFRPRYLTLWTMEICELFIERLTRGRVSFDFSGMISAYDFEGFTVSLFASSQKEMRLRSSFIFEVRTGKLWSEQIKQVSSAKSLGLLVTEDGRSLMYSRKRRSPRIDLGELLCCYIARRNQRD